MKKAKALLSSILVVLLVFGTVIMSYAAETNEKEPNNDKANATEFNINNVATGSLADTTDIDWFKVSATKFGMAFLTLTQKGSDDFKVTVYDSDDLVLASFNASGDKTDSQLFSVSNAAYYIKVEPGSVVSSASYTLELTSTTYDNGETEPNNDIANASIINLDIYHKSSIYMGSVKSGDEDWFRFDCVSGYFYYELTKVDGGAGSVTADVISIMGTGDSGNTVVGRINAGVKGKTLRSADIGTKDTVYFIRVTGNGAYSLAVQAFLDSKYECEYNDTTVFANPITINYNDRLYGSISHDGDVDMFKVTTTDKDKNSMITISAFSAEGYKEFDKNATWNVALLNSNGAVLEEKMATTAAGADLDLAKQGAGTYFIRVSKGSMSTIALYKLTSSESKEPEKEGKTLLERLRYDINWRAFWERNPFKELMGNVDILTTLGALFRTSFGTIIQWIMRLIASRAG